MKVFVTGGTGFVGSYVTPALLEAGHEIEVLARPGSAEKLPAAVRAHARLRILEGDILDPQALRQVGEDCEAIVHLIGIIEEKRRKGITFERLHIEAAKRVVELGRRLKVKRLVHMSALGSRENAHSAYHRSKYRGEFQVKYSGLPFVVFRPSLIFGPGDGFINLLKKQIVPVAPVIVPGNGKTLFQPVAVENVAEGVVKALECDAAVDKIYEIGGPDRISFDQIVAMIAEAKGLKSYYTFHVPLGLILPPMALLQYLPFVPATRDQLVMLREDSICDTRGFYDDLKIEPAVFNVESLKRYV